MSEANLARDEARQRAGLISDLAYEVSLDLTTAEEIFGCEALLTFRCSSRGAATFLDYSGVSVESIVLNGERLPVANFDGKRIELRGLKERNELRVVAHSAYQRTGVGMHRFVDPTDENVYLYTDLEPFEAHRVFPCFDQPDLKGTFRFAAEAPSGFTVISNMPVKTRPPDGEPGRWEFETTPKISTYITALIAGPYQSFYDEHDGMPLGVHCRKSLAKHIDPEEWFEITKEGFDYYHKVFDYRCPFPKYDQVLVPEFNSGAMENAGCVTFNEVYLYRSKVTEATRERRAEVILHELAHMWFGDLVTMTWWDDLWLNESFATYMAQMAQERTRFRTGWVTFANEVKAQARRQDQFVTTHPIAADIPDTLSTRVMFDAISYSKGASVLRQLVAWVSEEPFFEGVKTYFRRHAFGNTELTDFLTALEQASGRDLKSWSKEWIETAGLNTIAADFETDDGKYGSFALIQQAPPENPILRSHRLRVGLYDSTGDGVVLRRRIDLDVAGDRTVVPALVGEPVADLVLPNDGDLAYLKVRFDSRSLETIRRRLKMIRDPLARSMCWSAAWEMLQDGDFAASDYLDLVLHNLGEEADTRVVQNIIDKPRSTLSGIVYLLLGRVKAAIDLFGDPARRTEAIDSFAAFLERSVTDAEPGSDRQLIFARALVSAARSSDHIEVARGLLDDPPRFKGLEVGPDFRWLIVRSLAASGAASEELIASESARDPTDEGERMASRARAAFPTAEAKAGAWEAVTRDESLSRTAMVDLIAGLQQTGQEDLLKPYVEKYFAVLSEFWDSRSAEVSQAFAVYAYPHFIVDEGTLTATDEYLDGSEPPPPLQRLLLESRDGVARALQCRRRDYGIHPKS